MAVFEENGKWKSKRTSAEYQKILKAEFGNLTPEERKVALQVFSDLVKTGKSKFLNKATEIEYEYQPVGIRQFIEDPYYLGDAGSALFPKWKEDLISMFEGNYYEVILTGSIGIGKDYVATLAMCRLLYETLCLKKPQEFFGLAPDSTIHFAPISVTQTLAREVVFKGVAGKLEKSTFFKNTIGFKCLKDEIVFPKNITIVGGNSSDTSVLGLNIFGAILDETNFMGTTTRSIHGDSVNAMGKADLLYSSISRRMKSRFLKYGKLPGKLFILSSKKSITDFTERRIRESLDDPYVFVRDYALWDTHPPEKFSKERFKVFIGSELKPPRVIQEGDEVPTENVITVPEDFRRDFELDIHAALRDLAGVATVALKPFFQLRHRLEETINPARLHPAINFEWDAANIDTFRFMWNKLVQHNAQGELEPICCPNSPRHVHIDPSRVKDATGLCVAHVGGIEEVVRRDSQTGIETVEEAPIIHVDMIVRIVPPKGGEIQFANVRWLIYALSEQGVPIIHVTSDQYQSAGSLQQLERKGYKTKVLSVDISDEPYIVMKQAIYEGRLEMPKYPFVIQELRQLEYDRRRKKIDHPPTGCFVGETRIALAHGGSCEIKELDGQLAEVVSCKPDGTPTIGFARGKLTMKTQRLVLVTLSNGARIRCTPEHKWMLLDGSYKKASMLYWGKDKLMTVDFCSTVSESEVSKIKDFKTLTVRRVDPIKTSVLEPVYDLEVDQWSNFALASGAVVHNSKDTADALCGAVYALTKAALPNLPVAPEKGIVLQMDKNKNVDSSFIWEDEQDKNQPLGDDPFSIFLG